MGIEGNSDNFTLYVDFFLTVSLRLSESEPSFTEGGAGTELFNHNFSFLLYNLKLFLFNLFERFLPI